MTELTADFAFSNSAVRVLLLGSCFGHAIRGSNPKHHAHVSHDTTLCGRSDEYRSKDDFEVNAIDEALRHRGSHPAQLATASDRAVA